MNNKNPTIINQIGFKIQSFSSSWEQGGWMEMRQGQQLGI